MAARRYRVQGRVQGVGYRWFVEREARALKLTGYVRNCPDGSVEVLAEGPEPVLEALREKLERGPLGSRVAGVEVSEAPAASYQGFQITH